MRPKKCVVIGEGRTGSNLLISLLNSHKNVHIKGEVFGRLNDKSCKEIWDEVFSDRPSHIFYAGFKIFYNHPFDSTDRRVWEFLRNDLEIKIIHIKRRNMLRKVLSLEIAFKTNKWSRSHSDDFIPLGDKQVTLDPTTCIRQFEEIQKNELNIDQTFSSHKIHEVFYEELVRNIKDSSESIIDFLELPKVDLKTNLVKQNREPLRLLITNYDQLKEDLCNSGWSVFFEDE